jgi:glycosyltransferase involved in cell wall biosynthesis
MKNNLVSIVIPTYNRSHLIGQTLNSIISQTYPYWECLVIDDGSTDYTKELLEYYCEIDSRIKYFQRPSELSKGANACRNYGFEVSKGEFINWFDSDDIMTSDNLYLKLNSFDDKVDFVVGNTLNFDANGKLSRVYSLNYNLDFTPENLIGFRIGWITNDVMLRREVIKIKFNECIKSGQEYNFFARLLYHTNRGKYLKRDVAHRRLHSSSIQGELKKNKNRRELELFENEYYLLEDIKEYAENTVIKRSLRRMIRFSYFLTKGHTLIKKQYLVLNVLIQNYYFRTSLYYFSWVIMNLITGKGYFLLKKAHRSLA